MKKIEALLIASTLTLAAACGTGPGLDPGGKGVDDARAEIGGYEAEEPAREPAPEDEVWFCAEVEDTTPPEDDC